MHTQIQMGLWFNTLRPRQNGRHFADDSFKCIFLNENVWILLQISLKFVPMGSINTFPSLVWIMAWHHPGDKPISEPMVSLPMHICVTWPQWVNLLWPCDDIGQHRPGSTLNQVIACCLMTPSHYLSQCWLTIHLRVNELMSYADMDSTITCIINSLRPGKSDMHWWTGSSLVQILAFHLFHVK